MVRREQRSWRSIAGACRRHIMRLQIYTDESDGGERLIRAVKQEGVTVVREETEDADAVVLFLNGQESGFRRLEALRIKWQCPVVVVGHEERVCCYEEIRSLELGADDYVPAGTASNVLLLRLQRLFRLYRGQNGPFYYRNGLLECRDKRDYEWQGKPLRLTGKEYHCDAAGDPAAGMESEGRGHRCIKYDASQASWKITGNTA